MSEIETIKCPSCEVKYAEDLWECLIDGETCRVRCRACETDFFVALYECERCVEDSVVASLVEAECLDRTCRHCGYRHTTVSEGHEETDI